MISSFFRRDLAAALLVCASLASTSAAQQSFPPNPPVDSIFAEYDRTDSPGCALGVYRDGKIVYTRGYGMADLERRVAIAPHTVFDIGSTSKQFTAASILLLAQQGKLSLDDDVRRHVPELPVYSAPVTIRHLLHHTSGLRDYIGLMTLGGADIDDVTTEEEALTTIARQKELNFPPGTEHLYSNSGYFLLSVIVERASGMSLREFAREHIFAPLGMARTHYLGSYDDIVPDRALAYEPKQGGGLRTDISRWLQLGDGAVFTTVEELLLWDANFYDPKVGGASMLTELQTTGTLADGKALTYALGLMVDEYRGHRTVSHGGAWGGYRAELLRFPEQHFSVATLCNLGTTNPSALSHRVADVYLADVLEPRREAPAGRTASSGDRVAVPEIILRPIAGTYRNPTSRATRTLVLDGGTLHLAIGGGRYELAPRSATDFAVLGAPVEISIAIEPPAAGAPRRMRWMASGQEPLVFEQIELVTPTAAELASYAGSYFSDELETTHTIALEGDRLVLQRRGASPQTLRPLTRDEFAIGSMTVRFMRGDRGTVTGYNLDLGRIRNLRFQRVAQER
jgi:CubicO group peptidase (beta-lactamase class C family)